jgi:uncharacterized Fe-S radical SAM superfamily protein PflX
MINKKIADAIQIFRDQIKLKAELKVLSENIQKEENQHKVHNQAFDDKVDKVEHNKAIVDARKAIRYQKVERCEACNKPINNCSC